MQDRPSVGIRRALAVDHLVSESSLARVRGRPSGEIQMSLYRRKDSLYWWVKLPRIRGESGPLQQSTGTADKRQARQVHDRLAAARWEQDRVGVKARHAWEEAVVRWLLETKHKATHSDDKAKLRWLDQYLGGKYLDEIDRTLIDRIKFDREKIATAGTTNRYLALIRAILRRACGEWEWIERVPRFKLFRETEGRVRSLRPKSSMHSDANCRPIWPTWRCSRWRRDSGKATSRDWNGSTWTWIAGTPGFPGASTRTASRTPCR